MINPLLSLDTDKQNNKTRHFVAAYQPCNWLKSSAVTSSQATTSIIIKPSIQQQNQHEEKFTSTEGNLGKPLCKNSYTLCYVYESLVLPSSSNLLNIGILLQDGQDRIMKTIPYFTTHLMRKGKFCNTKDSTFQTDKAIYHFEE